jgi:hypothetical protein
LTGIFILGAQLDPLAISEVVDLKKTSFRPSKWPWKFRNQETAQNSKLLEDCFQLVGIGGWPLISTWIIEAQYEKFWEKYYLNQLTRIKHLGDIEDYISEFQALDTRVDDISDDHLLEDYMGGLKEYIKMRFS